MTDKVTHSQKQKIQIWCQDLKRFADKGNDFLDNGKLISASKQFNEISKLAEMLYLEVRT